MDVTRTYVVVQMVTPIEVNAEGRKKLTRIIFCSDTLREQPKAQRWEEALERSGMRTSWRKTEYMCEKERED